MIWQSGQLNKDLAKSIVPDVVKDRQLYATRNPSCQQGSRPNIVLQEIVEQKVYEKDYNDVTSKFIYRAVDYDACIASLKEIIAINIIPNHI